MKLLLRAATGLAAAACGVWLAWPEDAAQPAAASVSAEAASGAREPASLAPPSNWPPPMPYAEDEPARVPLPPVDQSKPAAQSMVETREHGDPRTPPIVYDAAPAEQPSAAELADPRAYQTYEERQNMRVYAAYDRAVADELPKLRESIARGRAAGIAAEEIAKAEEKLRRMEEMRDKLRAEHPQLGR
ncbi:MAG TPA: hypothetical protein VEC06_02580 [Paucimonas sp.]|nr:hypothetical protein [Paucimonas sp.]